MRGTAHNLCGRTPARRRAVAAFCARRGLVAVVRLRCRRRSGGGAALAPHRRGVLGARAMMRLHLTRGSVAVTGGSGIAIASAGRRRARAPAGLASGLERSIPSQLRAARELNHRPAGGAAPPRGRRRWVLMTAAARRPRLPLERVHPLRPERLQPLHRSRRHPGPARHQQVERRPLLRVHRVGGRGKAAAIDPLQRGAGLKQELLNSGWALGRAGGWVGG
jgi:hypothetical protein